MKDVATAGLPESRHKWDSRRLWSLLEMLEKYGHMLTNACQKLAEAKLLCLLGGMNDEQALSNKNINHDGVRAVAASAASVARAACIMVDLDNILPEIDRLDFLISPPHPDIQPSELIQLGQSIQSLILRIKDELGSQYFFHLTASDVPFYLDKEPFGTKVADKFDRANEDISEAGKCLALQRPTACVFHLMRVMELGVQTLGKKLKVDIDVRSETWNKIILHVNSKILALPSKTATQKKKKSSIAEAAAHLQSVRLAWRNEVMHPKQTYTRDEAYALFNATKVFMISLAEVV